MNKFMRGKSVLVSAILGVTWAGMAGPIQRADVPAEPAWVLHVDCDGLRPTVLGQFLLAELDKPAAQAKFAAFQSIFSFDPRKQLHGLTLYSLGNSPADGILLVYADFDPERLVTLARAAKEYQSTTYKQHEIHNWIDDRKKATSGAKSRTYAAIHGGRVVILGQRRDRIEQALDTIDASTPTLATSPAAALFADMPASSFIQAAGRKLDFPTQDPNAAMLKLSKSMRVHLGESQRQLTATATLEANDEEVATNMFSVAQGLIALGKMQKDKPESAKVAEALNVKQDGKNLLLTLSLPADDVVTMLKAGAAHKAALKAGGE